MPSCKRCNQSFEPLGRSLCPDCLRSMMANAADESTRADALHAKMKAGAAFAGAALGAVEAFEKLAKAEPARALRLLDGLAAGREVARHVLLERFGFDLVRHLSDGHGDRCPCLSNVKRHRSCDQLHEWVQAFWRCVKTYVANNALLLLAERVRDEGGDDATVVAAVVHGIRELPMLLGNMMELRGPREMANVMLASWMATQIKIPRGSELASTLMTTSGSAYQTLLERLPAETYLAWQERDADDGVRKLRNRIERQLLNDHLAGEHLDRLAGRRQKQAAGKQGKPPARSSDQQPVGEGSSEASMAPRKSRPLPAGLSPDGELQDPGPSVEDIVMRETVRAERLEGLTVREVEVASLYEQGLNQSEIAARLGINLNTVKTYFHRAQQKKRREAAGS
jgi:DNA-directed RNA polymerase specialized sigma24 family protein